MDNQHVQGLFINNACKIKQIYFSQLTSILHEIITKPTVFWRSQGEKKLIIINSFKVAQ